MVAMSLQLSSTARNLFLEPRSIAKAIQCTERVATARVCIFVGATLSLAGLQSSCSLRCPSPVTRIALHSSKAIAYSAWRNVEAHNSVIDLTTAHNSQSVHDFLARTSTPNKVRIASEGASSNSK
jgi:hypothetical protein